MTDTDKPINFIQHVINADLEAGHVTKVVTRFPPEPNGYLHIGHAKSMNMNFSLAFEKLGVSPENRETYFRYDDTNPEKESKEYIDSLRNDLTWLGWSPAKTTYSSEGFNHLHSCAVKLIKKGLAYVCFLTKAEVEQQREVLKKRVAVIAKGGDPEKQCEVGNCGERCDELIMRYLAVLHHLRK